MPETLTLRLTGAPVLRVGGRDIALDGLAAVLAARVALDGPQSRALLARLLWPDVEPARARANLRQRLLRLKQQAGVEWVAGEATLALTAGLQVEPVDDPHAADLLQGVALDAHDDLARWLDGARERQRQQRLLALDAMARSAEAGQRWADAIDCVQRQLLLEPLGEAHHHALVRLHYLSGDLARARMAYDRCVDILRRDLGLQPGPALHELAALLDRARPASPAAGAAPALWRPPRLKGRESELRALARVAADGAVALLVAEAGQGKTRLLAECAQGLPGLGQPLQVGARPGDQRVPYALASRWLQSLLPRLRAAPDAAARRALAALKPEWRDAQDPSQGGADALRAAALATLTCAVQDGLRVILVDDLHFADAASLELIGDLVTRAPAEAHCAWLLALRPDEGDAALPALVQQVEAWSSTLRLDLASLDVEAVQALVASLGLPGLGGLEQAGQLHRLTGGNPLFVLETLKALPDGATVGGGPIEWPRARSVLRLIQQRLARLSPQATQVMRCAAVAGSELQAQRVARVLGLRPLDLADAWAELESAQVLRGEAFAHDLIAEAAAATVPTAVAAPLHAELAQLLEAEGAADAARVASHWLTAGQPLRAAPQLCRAARRAVQQGRLLEAGRMAAQAAAIFEQAGQRDAAFDAWFDAANAMSEADLVDQTMPCVDALDRLAASDEQRAAAACARIYVLAEQQQLPAALSLAVDALSLARSAEAADLEVELLWSCAALQWEQRQGAVALELIERALERARSVDPTRARLPVARTVGKLEHAGAVVAQSLGLGDKARRLLEHTLSARRPQGDHLTVASCSAALTKLALDQGDRTGSVHWKAEFDRAWARLSPDEQEARFVEKVELIPILGALGVHGEALALADAAMQRTGPRIDRAQDRTAILASLAYHELGRTDLAQRGLRDLARRDDLIAMDRLRLAAALVQLGAVPPAADLLVQVSELADAGLRARMLCQLHRACAADQILPLVSLAAGQAQDQGNHGHWLALQACRLSALRRTGRDARPLALDLWARLQGGLVGPLPFAAVAVALCVTLADSDADLAVAVAMKARAWMLDTSASLPPMWRDSYLTRAPLLLDLGPRERAVMLGLPGAAGAGALPG